MVRACVHYFRLTQDPESASGNGPLMNGTKTGPIVQTKEGDEDDADALNDETAALDSQALWQLEQRLQSSCNAPFTFLLLGGATCGMSSCYLAVPWASFH